MRERSLRRSLIAVSILPPQSIYWAVSIFAIMSNCHNEAFGVWVDRIRWPLGRRPSSESVNSVESLGFHFRLKRTHFAIRRNRRWRLSHATRGVHQSFHVSCKRTQLRLVACLKRLFGQLVGRHTFDRRILHSLQPSRTGPISARLIESE